MRSMTVPDSIAIDGPVAAGKTTVGRALALRLGYAFVDTGLMYRAVAYLALERGVPLTDHGALGALAEGTYLTVVSAMDGGSDSVFADGKNITSQLRSPEVEGIVSTVAEVPGVRNAMVAQQQRMAASGHVVMVGRDIGTNVLPGATKVYLEASPGARTARRLAEVQAKGVAVMADAVRENLELRDRLDSERAANPLRVADDAITIDTEDLDVAGVVDRIIELTA